MASGVCFVDRLSFVWVTSWQRYSWWVAVRMVGSPPQRMIGTSRPQSQIGMVIHPLADGLTLV